MPPMDKYMRIDILKNGIIGHLSTPWVLQYQSIYEEMGLSAQSLAPLILCGLLHFKIYTKSFVTKYTWVTMDKGHQ